MFPSHNSERQGAPCSSGPLSTYVPQRLTVTFPIAQYYATACTMLHPAEMEG